MSMTRKHFEAVAKSIKAEIELVEVLRTHDNRFESDTALDHLHNTARSLAEAFKGFNPNFNSVTFLTACGIVLKDQ